MKTYYYIGNSDNQIHKTDDGGRYVITPMGSYVQIEILTEEGEVIDLVDGHETLGDLMEAMNGGGNDLE
jgi:hypothetical protein